MKEDEEITTNNCDRDIQKTQSMKSKQLSLESKHRGDHSDCRLVYKPKNDSFPVTKEKVLAKKFKKSEVVPDSHSVEHHQSHQHVEGINNTEESDEVLYNKEEDKLEPNVLNKSMVTEECIPFSCSDTNSVNGDKKLSLFTKPELDSTGDCVSAVSPIIIPDDLDSKGSEEQKYKFSSIKRRAGLLYKQIMNSKLNSVNSEYFLLKKNCSDPSKLRWIPPRSPYALIQEDLFDKPWQLLIATIFLTKVSAKKALPQIHKFLERWPRPEHLLLAEEDDLHEYMKPLGLTVTRSHAIMRFTVEFLEKDWNYPRELYGIGKYGDDSYRMFCINEWRQVRPDDIPLNLYRNWLLENAEALGLK